MSFYGNSKEWLEAIAKHGVPCNIERILRSMTQEQLERVELLLPKFREKSHDDWQWCEDEVWRKTDAEGNVLASVWQGTEYNTIPGQHWLWGLGEPQKPDDYYQRNCYCPYEARAKANELLEEKNE